MQHDLIFAAILVNSFPDDTTFVCVLGCCKMQMYCPPRIGSQCSFNNYDLIKPCMDLIHPQIMSF